MRTRDDDDADPAGTDPDVRRYWKSMAAWRRARNAMFSALCQRFPPGRTLAAGRFEGMNWEADLAGAEVDSVHMENAAAADGHARDTPCVQLILAARAEGVRVIRLTLAELVRAGAK